MARWSVRDWRNALLTGVLTSTVSTILIALGLRRIGRTHQVTWMEVATVPIRESAVVERPGIRQLWAGIATHQFADLAWATVFFGLAGPWTARLRPRLLLPIALAWAPISAAIEYWGFVTWLSPILKMQTPYWIGLLAHCGSAAAYPVHLLLRRPRFRPDATERRLLAGWLALVGGVAAGLAALEVAGRFEREPRWPFGGQRGHDFNRRFLRSMTAHHEQGLVLSRLAAERATRPDRQMLGRLMAAEHAAELRAMRDWWRAWYGGDVPEPSPEEHRTMPGMPPWSAIDELRTLEGTEFDDRFSTVMIQHHMGAVVMCSEALRRSPDPRLRLTAAHVKHAQEGQIARMATWREAATVVPRAEAWLDAGQPSAPTGA